MHHLTLLALACLAAPAVAQTLPQPVLDGDMIQVRPPGAPTAMPARTLGQHAADVIQAADNGIVCDGATDIGPAMQALVNRLTRTMAATIQMPPGSCLWNTAVTVRSAIRLRGHGAPGAGTQAMGTTLRTTNPAITPLTFSAVQIGAVNSISFSTDGAEISDVALEQAQPAPGPGWAPTAYAPFFANVSAPGVRYSNIMGNGIYAGISNTGNSGRFEARGIRGQFFAYAIYDDASMDTNVLTDFHVWPFWSSHPAVIAWQQANTDGIRLLRTDGPQLDRIVVFSARSGLRLSQSASGVPSKVQVGSLNADATRTAIWIDSGTNITLQVANMTHQGAQGVSTPAPLPGSSAIQVDQTAGAVIQVGRLQSEFDELHTVNLASTANRSLVRIESMYVRDIVGGGQSSLFYAGGTGTNLPHDIRVATAPIVAPSAYMPTLNYATTNAIMEVPGADTQVVSGVPTSGGTYGITSARRNLVLMSSNQNAVPSLVIRLPDNPFEGQEASIMATVPVASVTFSATTDVVGGPKSLKPFETVRFKHYMSGNYAWIRQ